MGICEFYTNLTKNNYKMIYLTARNFGQTKGTLKYLDSLEQGKFRLPEGPLILSPQSFYQVLKTEVISGNLIQIEYWGGKIFYNHLLTKDNPEEFKIKALQEIKQLFVESGNNSNPLYAAFGNKKNDSLAYLTMGIKNNRVFIINPKGDIRLNGRTHSTSYSKLNERIGEIFPLINSTSINEFIDNDYSHLTKKMSCSFKMKAL